MSELHDGLEHELHAIDRELVALADTRAEALTRATPGSTTGTADALRYVELLAQRALLAGRHGSAHLGTTSG